MTDDLPRHSLFLRHRRRWVKQPATRHDIRDIRDVIETARDTATDYREVGQVIYDKAGRARAWRAEGL